MSEGKNFALNNLKVKELIEELSKHDPEGYVMVVVDEGLFVDYPNAVPQGVTIKHRDVSYLIEGNYGNQWVEGEEEAKGMIYEMISDYEVVDSDIDDQVEKIFHDSEMLEKGIELRFY
jgi:hypothetical protein